VKARHLLALILLLIWTATAAAQPDALTRAQALFDDAQRALMGKDYDTAATKFREAHDARPLPDLLYNVGTAYYLKGKANNDAAAYEMAVQYYKKYLVAVPAATDKAEVDKAIAVIEKEIARLKAPPAGPDAPPVAPSEEVQQLDQKTRSLVVIETEPQGANIYLDDKKNGVFAQTPWSGSLDGQHKVIIEKRGHKSKESTVAPDPNRLVVLQVVLSEEDYLGWLEIRANVPGAAIFLDDKASGAIGKTPFSGNLKPGKHKVWISADGYDESVHDVEIIAGETHEISATLSGTPVGYLDIRGSDARVYVDGKLICERAPCRKPVAEGSRSVAIARGGYKTYRTRVDVQSKTEISIKPNLKKKPGRGDAVVAYIFSAAFLGGATYAYFYQDKLEMGDKNFDRKDQIKIGAYVGWGLGGVIGLSAVYYTFRDKGPPSTGQIDVRAVALEPVVGKDYAGLSVGGRF
jgi:hypothetical protein